jgi:hypothetical protein
MIAQISTDVAVSRNAANNEFRSIALPPKVAPARELAAAAIARSISFLRRRRAAISLIVEENIVNFSVGNRIVTRLSNASWIASMEIHMLVTWQGSV